MKKTSFIMVLAVAAGLASCTAQSPKANLTTDIDSLSYAFGMARTEGLDQYLMQQGVDSTLMGEFLKGFQAGTQKTSQKDVAYMMGQQIGQMVSKNWVEALNRELFGVNDSVNTVNREQMLAGFLAGVATALKLVDGEVGFVGGLEIPAVQKFNWGFQQGVAYANDNLGTNIAMNANNFTYSGSFADLALGQQLATAMYDSGVDAIFAAAGGTGVGVINEAKNRRLSGEDVWAIGVDVDQYSVGDMGNGESCILTSAMKDVAGVAYDQASAAAKGTFQGGVHIELGVSDGRAGIPASNPNLTPEIEAKVAEVAALVADGTIVVQDTGDGLIR